MLPDVERKAIQAIYPYISECAVIVDVGSNKGEWAEVLIDHVSQMHLFEPNSILRNYTQVKFCHLRNVTFHNYALSDKTGLLPFYYFTNENNGLSSLYNNPKWDDLPKKEMSVPVRKLDDMEIPRIDLLKIDVEGADLDVLKGADRMLTEKKIRFIQVEKSEHIHLAGYTFENIVEFMNSKEYIPYHFNGTNFEYYTNQDAENIYFMQEGFTQIWNAEFIKNTQFLKGKVKFALEVGAFEGLTTKYICENLLVGGPDSRMIVVDPLAEVYLPSDRMRMLGYEPDDPKFQESCPDFKNQYERFVNNTRGLPVELVREGSRPTWKTEAFYHYRFDFIYIDGDHTEDEVFNDGMEAFRCCLQDGYILFDDYGWESDTKEFPTKRGIDAVLRKLDGFYERVHLDGDYQVMIKKIQNIQ